ncbi:hypothetical protein TNCV_2269501 [Trichonephila clavipes]|nr:hypothetical protein TNCV_2269501 [Trichonephila clavipes]
MAFRQTSIALEGYEFRPRKTMLVNHGINSLHHRRYKVIDSLGLSLKVQRCDSRKAIDLDCKLDVPGLPIL